jgi:hypothetical protein
MLIEFNGTMFIIRNERLVWGKDSVVGNAEYRCQILFNLTAVSCCAPVYMFSQLFLYFIIEYFFN